MLEFLLLDDVRIFHLTSINQLDLNFTNLKKFIKSENTYNESLKSLKEKSKVRRTYATEKSINSKDEIIIFE